MSQAQAQSDYEDDAEEDAACESDDNDEEKDWSDMIAKADHSSRPLFVGKNRHCFLERFSPLFKYCEDFMIAISEPVSRCRHMNEYVMTQHSLHAAVSIGLTAETIILRLKMYSKTELDEGQGTVLDFIRSCTSVYGKVKMVIVDDRFYLETPRRAIFEKLTRDPVILSAKTGHEGQGLLAAQHGGGALKQGMQVLGKAHVLGGLLSSEKEAGPEGKGTPNATAAAAADDQIARLEACMDEVGEGNAGRGGTDDQENAMPTHLLWHVEIDRKMHLDVKKQCLLLDYPCLEEYDFAKDQETLPLRIEVRPETFTRSYQERALSKMFAHGRARSGFIVLPCGAGKTLVGIRAVATIKKCAAVICNTSLAVTQWKQQFMSTWTDVKESDITCFVSKGSDWEDKPLGNLLITTYPMITLDRRRSRAGEALIDQIRKRQWAIIVLDEVHLSFADTFWKVFNVINAHCKLGLTATLVREDDKIKDLKNLIGPKLYEADWQDLKSQGYLARVQCVEVWCPMTPKFMEKYLTSTPRERKDLWIMNPNKLAAVEFLVEFFEAKGDKIIVFSDALKPVEEYSRRMNRPCMTGSDNVQVREELLGNASSQVKTIFMSSVGDAAIDLPDASVIIQISSNFGSRQKEAQRLGRVLRPKTGSNDEYNAHFYTLVSKDTQEMYYSTKRQRYLVDQGYAFKVVTKLDEKDGEDLFSRSRGKGKYGGTKIEALLLECALEGRKEAKARADAQTAEASEGASVGHSAATGPRHEIFNKRRKR